MPMRHGGQPTPAFGGVTDLISAGVGKLENRFVELLVTDVGGMGLPRTTLEAVKRGPDAARENAIRDFTGTFFNMFALGIFSRMMLKMFGDHIGALNPKGVNARAWIDADLLSAFGDIYHEVLKDPSYATKAEVRREFVKRTLRRLEAGGALLGQEAHKAGLAHVDEATRALVDSQLALGTKQGRLTWAGILQLATDLEQKQLQPGVGKPGLHSVTGVSPIDEMAEKIVKSKRYQAARRGLFDEVFKDGLDIGLLRERLRQSMMRLKGEDRDALRLMVETAKKEGLSSSVNVVDDAGKVVVKGKNLELTLRQIGHMLEEVVDRSTHGVNDKAAGWKDKVAERMFAVNRKGLMGKLFPRAGDGLIDYIKKSKTLYVVIPLILTVSSAVTVAFINNWITKMKNGGKDYFPGERAAMKNVGANAGNVGGGQATEVPPLRRPVFYDMFARQPAGGAQA